MIGIVFPIIVTAGTALFLRKSKLGTAMRALANDREITSMLGVPVRASRRSPGLGPASSAASPACCSPSWSASTS
jgi:branched-chain amino acid transport system permease protein